MRPIVKRRSPAYAGHVLERRRIEFKPVKAKYLRLSWSMRQPFTLSAVCARPVAAAVEAEREWLAPAADPLAQLVRENQDRASARGARAGAPRTLGGATLLTPATVIAWKKWILWAAIAGGVLLLAWMAHRLWRELNAKPPA